MAETYGVYRTQDGAVIGTGMTEDVARSEKSRLNAAAAQPVTRTREVRDDRGNVVIPSMPVYASMYMGEISRYEVRSSSGIVVE